MDREKYLENGKKLLELMVDLNQMGPEDEVSYRGKFAIVKMESDRILSQTDTIGWGAVPLCNGAMKIKQGGIGYHVVSYRSSDFSVLIPFQLAGSQEGKNVDERGWIFQEGLYVPDNLPERMLLRARLTHEKYGKNAQAWFMP